MGRNSTISIAIPGTIVPGNVTGVAHYTVDIQIKSPMNITLARLTHSEYYS